MVSEYGEIQQLNKAQVTAATEIIPTSTTPTNSNPVSHTPSTDTGMVTVGGIPASSSNSSLTGMDHNTAASTIPVTTTAISAYPTLPDMPHPIARGVSTSTQAAQEMQVKMMMDLTGESFDSCTFYLESTNWDIQQAVDLMNAMTMK